MISKQLIHDRDEYISVSRMVMNAILIPLIFLLILVLAVIQELGKWVFGSYETDI